ncbi:MAG: hypothetical protein LBB81_01860 [Treponema sp.]|jgi:hypothetical protein|nr:hypothetical protein [Treponema sp.]
MKRRFLLVFVLIFFIITGSLAAQSLVFSGLLDSSAAMSAGAGDAPDFSYGFEEFANIRMQARINEKAVFFGAVNLIAASGSFTQAASQLGYLNSNMYNSGLNSASFITGDNYIAGIELERLYFRLNWERVSLDAGLMRVPFGYSQIWGPMDFLNPKNPLAADARPRAILGGTLFWYPTDDLKLLGLAAAPRDPFSGSNGTFTGLFLEQHWDKISIQSLYVFETPAENSSDGIHRAGLSVKADVEAGLTLEALYTYNNETETRSGGLSLSAGIDYSFFDGNLIVMTEYLYNGKTSSTAFDIKKNIFGRLNKHYLYTGFTCLFSDYTSLTAALLSCFSDVSFTPVLSLNHELFQGAALTVSARFPLDRNLFKNDGSRGELGPIAPGADTGSYFNFSTKLRLRF